MKFTHLSEVNNLIENTTKVRSDLNIVGRVKLGKPQTVDSFSAVVWSLADCTNDLDEMCGVKLYESVIDVIVQSTAVAFRNFYRSRISVLMDQSDFDFTFVIMFIQTVWIHSVYEDVLVFAGAITSTIGEMKHSSSGMLDSKLDGSVLTSIR